MKSKFAPLIGALTGFAFACLVSPVFAQLPPTNMGKFVHQPGDNQYTQATQNERHPVIQAPQYQNQRMMLMPASQAAPQVDVSIQPITCDEPIPVAGFPPLPDQFDLPVSLGGNWKTGGGGNSGSGSTGGVSYHQHYGHVPLDQIGRQRSQPQGDDSSDNQRKINSSGNWQQADDTANAGQSAQQAQPQDSQTGSVGYYKARTAPVMSRDGVGYYRAATAPTNQPDTGSHGYYKAVTVPTGQPDTGSHGYYRAGSPGGDVYNSNQSAAGQPQYSGATNKDLQALGREPKLNADGTPASDSASAIQINQSTTQDLSLPEDNSTYKYLPPSGAEKAAKGAAKGVGKVLKGPLNMMGGYTGMHF